MTLDDTNNKETIMSRDAHARQSVFSHTEKHESENHLKSLYFLKYCAICDLGEGMVARQVAMFSGCSTQSLCRTPFRSSS